MVLDGLSAIAVASAVVQFLDFAAKLVSKSHEAYSSSNGNSQENVDLSEIAGKLSALGRALNSSWPAFTHVTERERSLKDLAISCTQTSDSILAAIEALKVRDGPNRKWESFRKALKSLWKKSELEALEKRMDGFRKQLTLELVVDIRNNQSKVLNEIQNVSWAATRMESERRSLMDEVVEDVKAMRRSMDHLLGPKWESDIAEPNAKQLNTMHEIASSIAHSATKAFQVNRESEILGSLFFKTITTRQDGVAEAHSETFSWAFDSSRYESNFINWLRSQTGFFWVSGKAGSGKSTLMKFLKDHTKTRKAFQHWAGERQCVTASYYFWSAGTYLQRSQEGLLRSLLWEVLRKCPDLIPTVCRNRWGLPQHYKSDSSWTFSELTDAINRLIEQCTLSAKFCFFIDGLDEYEGDHDAVIKILSRLCSSSAIKICVSSRPWNRFEDTFGLLNNRKLYVHDLTRLDIRLYVRDKLENHRGFAPHLLENAQYKALVEEIVSKSQGVFLWVYLVVKSLQEGLRNGDDIQTLGRRLKALPTDLEPFFDQMLRSIDPIYTTVMAETFLHALEADESIPLLMYSFLHKGPKSAIEACVKPFDNHDIFVTHSRMRRQINGISKGLLEVSVDAPAPDFVSQKVDFLHRTVRDFLRTDHMHNILRKLVSPTFNPNFNLARGYLALIKAAPLHLSEQFSGGNVVVLERISPFTHWAKSIFKHVRRYEAQTEMSDTELLMNIQEIICCNLEKYGAPTHLHAALFRTGHTILELAAKEGLNHYVRERLDASPSYIDTVPLLRAVMLSDKTDAAPLNPDIEENTEMAQFLIARGAEVRFWKEFLPRLTRFQQKHEDVDFNRRKLKILKQILDFGANPNVTIDASGLRVSDAIVLAIFHPPDTYQSRYRCDILRYLVQHGAYFTNQSLHLLQRSQRLLSLDKDERDFIQKIIDDDGALKQVSRRPRCGCSIFGWMSPLSSDKTKSASGYTSLNRGPIHL